MPVAGRPFTVRRPSAAEWVEAMLCGQGPDGLLLELADRADAEELKDALAVGNLEPHHVTEASHELLTEAIPYKWWESARLLILSSRADIVGRTVVAGMDPWKLTPAQWCAGVYRLCTENMDEKGLFKFDAAISSPPAGVDDMEWGEESFDVMVAQARQMPGMG